MLFCENRSKSAKITAKIPQWAESVSALVLAPSVPRAPTAPFAPPCTACTACTVCAVWCLRRLPRLRQPSACDFLGTSCTMNAIADRGRREWWVMRARGCMQIRLVAFRKWSCWSFSKTIDSSKLTRWKTQKIPNRLERIAGFEPIAHYRALAGGVEEADPSRSVSTPICNQIDVIIVAN